MASVNGNCRRCVSPWTLLAVLLPHVSAAGDAPTVAQLPLQRGYYVASDTPCREASNATLLLLRRDGVGGARDFCEFVRIERVGASSYRVVEKCMDFQGSDAAIGVSFYQIQSETRFTVTNEQGWRSSARYCEQSSLPSLWRDNDISDLIR